MSETTPLLSESSTSSTSSKMPEKNIGISQQTLVSRGGESVNKARKVPQYVAGLASTLGALAAGMVLGWTSPAGENGIELDKQYNIRIDDEQFAWIGSIFNLGAAAICVPIGIICDKIGRKKAMLLLTIPFTIGWLLIIFSSSVKMFYIGRFILGVSGGAFCVTAPMYTAEIAESSIRGTLGSYFQLMLTVGILMTYTLGTFMSMRVLSIVSAIVPLVFCAVFIMMPETPVYLLKKGQINSARSSYRWLRGSTYDIEPEMTAQNEALAEANRNTISFLSAIKTKAARRGLIIAFGLMTVQQLSGVNAIIFYSGKIFKSAGANMDPNLQTVIVGIMQVVAVFISTLIVDRLGRRVLLLVSSAFMCISAFTMGFYFNLQSNGTDVSSISWVPLVAICLFIVLFSIGFGPIPWMMMGEIFSPQIKGIAGSSACLFNWIMAFFVTKFYSNFESSFGSDRTFWIFSFICALGFVFVFLIVPETKGKTLEEIQCELSGEPITTTTQNNNSNSNSKM